MIDIDHFKKYNDHYGHQGGDDCLRRVAGQASLQVRANDLFARYGGEEFVVVLPGATLLTVAEVAERLRTSIAHLALPHAGRPDGSIVTISLGIASLIPIEIDRVHELIELADQNLYVAKKRGRNQVGGVTAKDAERLPADFVTSGQMAVPPTRALFDASELPRPQPEHRANPPGIFPECGQN